MPSASRNTARVIPGILPERLLLLADSFWSDHGDEVSAAITLAIAIILALLVDRFLIGRAERATESLDTGQFSREARTRLRLIRRLVFLVIISVGIALALSQFTSIKRLRRRGARLDRGARNRSSASPAVR